jgi:hypothetical protein
MTHINKYSKSFKSIHLLVPIPNTSFLLLENLWLTTILFINSLFFGHKGIKMVSLGDEVVTRPDKFFKDS